MTFSPPLTQEPEAVLFERMACGLRTHGFSIQAQALSPDFVATLRQEATGQNLRAAGVGRHSAYGQHAEIRRDHIAWIEGTSPTQTQWLDWAQRLQVHVNRALLLGLFSFESHFAHYAPGAFYARHVDAFKGQSNRVLSLVTYLNTDWDPADGGELVLYSDQDEQQELCRVSPEAGTVVLFLSEDFPHEVLPAKTDRHSIAGWYRINTSSGSRIDPPR